ncbi:MAG: autotransporter-associated beta strand repeat-containing protein, partial [Verrucomicrobiae bacterium]|nr:autotransporter-associated beta strand repeat-containing protein [Verrucomicrobiae bacterium]
MPQFLRMFLTGAVITGIPFAGINPAAYAAPAEWGVTESGEPGVFSWQHLFNWFAPGSQQSPLAIPGGIGESADLSKVDLGGDLVINLDGAVTLGSLTIGDLLGQESYVVAPGSGGSLTFNNGGTATLTKKGLGTDAITSGIALTDPVTIDVQDGRLVLSGVLSGANGFTKTGDGTLILAGSAANTYTGVTTLNDGITLVRPQANNVLMLGTTGGATVINDGATLASSNDLDSATVGAQTSGGWGTISEPMTIHGDGHLGQGALRKMMGREQDTFGGTVTLGSNARLHSDYGTLALSGAVNIGANTLTASGAAGFVSLSSSSVSGSGDIVHYGLSGFRLQGNSNTFTGNLISNLGEIRADTGDNATGNNPYDTIASLSLRNSALRLNFPNAAGPSVADSRFSTTAPISMRSSYLYVENASFSAGTSNANLFDYAVAQTFGVTTLTGGGNKITTRSADTGSVTLTFTDLQRPNAGTTLELQIDNLVGGSAADWGASAKHRIINLALEGDGITTFPTAVPIIPWGFYGAEFLEYDPVALGGHGYSKLDAGDYTINQAEGTWAAGQNIKVDNGNFTISADRSIQTLNIQGGTDRTVSGAAGTTLEITHGGMLFRDDGHTLSVPFVTAGSGSDYELYDIAWSFHTIRSEITDNSGNPVSLTKAGGNTTRYLGTNSYTGTTYLVEGMFQDIIGARNLNALGSGNLHMIGDADSQGAYENDQDFTRALGSGVGEVQLTGGGGFSGGSVGFSAYGAPIDINFGGAGAQVTWGSAFFNPGIFTLNGGNAAHVATLVNDLDLGGEQRYIRLDGSSSGGNRQVMGTIAGDITNGGIVKQGGGVLFFEDAKSYMGSTIIREGELWLRNGTGMAGANVTGNDIQIGSASRLKIDAPSSIGSRQMIIMENQDDNSASAIAFGSGYGDGSKIQFHSIVSANSAGIPQTGPFDINLANQQRGNDRRNRIALQISGNHEFSVDLPGQIKTVAPDVEAWFGADTGNGTYVGTTLSATGRTKTGGTEAFRLGSGGGTLTIANENVLSGAFPLFVGAQDQNGRTNIGGVVFIPKAQNYSGSITSTVSGGNLIGSGGILVTGQDGVLNNTNQTVLLRGAELRLGVDKNNAFSDQSDTQYAARNLDVRSANSTLRTIALGGGYFGEVHLNNVLLNGTNRVLSLNSIGTTYMKTVVNNITFDNGGTAANQFLDVGSDNSFQSGVGILQVNGVISQPGAGAISLQKRQGGVLILNGDNTYAGSTNVQQGRLLLGNIGAAGNAGSTINLNTNSDRRSDLEFRIDGTGPFVFNNVINTTGGNDNSTRVITVGSMNGSSSNQLVQVPTLTIGHGGAFSTNGGSSSAVYFDGFNGYQLEITNTLNLNRDIVLRTRGALVNVSGVIAGAAANDLEKSEQGTLWLSGNNTYAGNTTISNGYMVLGHDNALGTATSDVVFRNSSFTQILASGSRSISRNFINTGTGSTQTIGGLDPGAKTFSGNINLSSRGMSLTAVSGGDTTFSGTISGAFGITKTGNGTVILNPASGGNTFNTGGVSISQGTLVGQAQAAGDPFGVNNPFTIANGELRLANNTGATNTTATTGGLTINGGNAALSVDASGAGGNPTTFSFGSLTRSNNSTLTFKGLTTDLGGATNEMVSFGTAPAVSNGTIGTWAAIQASGSNAAHFAGVSGSNIVTATYTASGVDLDTAAGATDLLDISGVGGALSANRSVYAFRTDTGVVLNGFTLNVGNPNSGTAGQAGMILNNGADISGGKLDFGTNALAIYTDDAGVSSIGAEMTNFRDNRNNTLATRLVKYGPGTLEMSNANNSFQANLQVNQGTLSLTAPNVMPNFANLNAVTGTTVTIQPGATVALNGNNQEFGNLAGTSVVDPVRSTAGTLDLGTATLVLGRQGSSTTFSGQLIGGAGSKITKVGGGRLTLNNWDASIPNSLGTLEITQGVVQTWLNDQSWATPTGFANAIPASTTILLRGGEWEAYVNGDSTSNWQVIPLGHSIVHEGADSILDTNRWQGSAANKIVVFDDLTLDKQRFLVTGGNAIYPRFDGTITLNSNARIQTDAPLLLNGTITGNYTLTKTGSSNLEIGGDNSAWSGGTVATDGTILFGSRLPERAENYQGSSNHFIYSATANLGKGDIVVNRNTAIRINAPTNILSGDGQRVQVFGDLRGNLPRVDIGLDAPVTDYNLRSLGNGALNLGLNDGFYTHTIDQSKLGNGKWGVGAWTTTFYTAPTMGAGADNTFRFLGTNAVLGITTPHALSGGSSLWVGAPQYDQGFALGNSSAQVRLYGDQSYTGNTTIFRSDNTGNTNNFLSILGDSLSPVFDVYGRLEFRGDGRATRDDGNQFNTVNLYPGSHLRLDYSMDVNDTMLISRLDNSNLGLESDENKWGDSTPMLLRGATLNMVNSSGRQNQERIGAMTVEQGSAVYLERNGTNGQIVLSTPSVTRVGQATFAVRENANELGRVDLQGQKFFIDNGATMLDAQGLMPVWMINPSRNTFLTYNDNFGVQNASFTQTASGAGTGATFLAGLTATDIASYGTGIGDPTLTGTANVWALRISHEASSNDTTLTGGQINIHSGGLIVDNRDNARVNFNTTNVYFGDGTTPVEGVVYSDQSNQTTRLGGVVTADDLTMHGAGNLQLTNTANAITGNIQMNSGKLFLDGAGTAGSATITLGGDWLQNNDGQQMAELWLRTNNNASQTWTNGIIVAENVPYARIIGGRYTGTSTGTGTNTIPSLTILGNNTLQGTSLIIGSTGTGSSENTHNLTVSGNTTIGGTAPVGLRIEQTNRVLQLQGTLSSTAPITKNGNGILRLDANNTGLDQPVTINRGEVRGQGSNTNNFFGTGDYTVNFGTIGIYHNNTGTYFNAPGQDLIFAGAGTINSNRNGGANAANLTFGTNNGDNTIRTINGAHFRLNAASFGDDYYLESNLIVNDSAVLFTDNSEVFTRGELQGSGRLTKSGIWYLYFDENTAGGNADWHGILDIQTGSVVQRQANDTLGGAGSSVIVRAGTALGMHSTAGFGTGAGVTSVTRSTTHLPVLGVRTIANFASVLDSYNSKFVGTGFGVVAIDNGQNLSSDPAMASRFGGNWHLGSNNGNGTLSVNSLSPWGAGGNKFLLGGGSATLTMNPSTAGSAQLAGANQLILGSANNVFGYGTVIMGANSDNTHTGGTLVTRSRNMDGGYRGFVLSLQGGAVGTTTGFRSPLGGGIVDLFGEARIEGASGTAVTTGGTTNANNWVFHPGSRLRIDNNTPFTGSGTTGNRATGTLGGGGRWADSIGITLDGAVLELFGDNTDHIANREVIGDLTISRGAEVVLRRDTGDWVELSSGNITRSGSGTLQITTMVVNTNTSGILGTIASNANSTLFLANNGASLMNNNMVDPWIVSRFDNQFVKYDGTLGFQTITQGGAPANYVDSAAATLDGSVLTLNNGTEILNATANPATLGANLDLYALRVSRDIHQSADGQFQNIIIRSGGLIQAGNTPTINANLYFGANGDGTGEALIHASNNVLQINGKIHASQVTKFGTSALYIRSDQPQFTGDWVVNGGNLRFLTPGAQGSGEVILNGSRMNDRDNTLNLTEVQYIFNSGTPDLLTWNGGKITAFDVNRVLVSPSNDRLQQIPAIDLRTTNTVAGTGQEGTLFFQVDGARSTARTGTVTLYDHYLIHVEAGSYGSPGATTGVQFGALDGTGGLNNQGQFDLRKVGDGVLTLGNNTVTFTGGRTITVGEGSLRVLHDGAFGGAGNFAHVNSTGALEIAVSGFNPSATVTQDPGSAERWAVDGARSGNYNLPEGVSLQVMANQTGTQTIGIDGGSIMGYLPRDWDQVAVIHTLGSNITIDLASDSYLGQPYAASTNGVWDLNRYYDQGKINTTTGSNPTDPALRGSYLQIEGAITGTGGITKVGQDLILLKGANTYTGATRIENGILQIGRDNSLPIGTSLELATTSGTFDLNGFNQEVASLFGAGGSVNNGAFDFNTLKVNQSGDTSFSGTIDGNVTLHKSGSGTLTLTPVAANGDTGVGSGYRGGTILEGGKIAVAQDTALGQVPVSSNANNLRFRGGTLRATANLALHLNRGILVESAGGTFETDAGVTAEVSGAITGVGGLSKTGSGILQVNHAGNDYSGSTQVVEGTLRGGGAGTFSEGSRHVVFGGVASGVLDTNGQDQVIGSLSSSGATPSNASVVLGGATLSVGADRSQDAVYAGSIGGSGVLRVNGAGAVQTLSGADNSAQGWSTEVVKGRLVLEGGARLGSGTVTLGVSGQSASSDHAALHLQNTAVLSNNVVVGSVIGSGSASISAGGGSSALTGTVTLNRDTMLGAAVGNVLSLENTVSGDGRVVVGGGGTVRLTGANSYGAGVGGSAGNAIDGGTVVRAGTLLVENSSGAGAKHIELGDATSAIGAAVDRATFSSVLGGGVWNPNGDGASATSGGQNAAGTTGQGAFIGVTSTIDGNTYTLGDVGTRLLIAGEDDHPERNGVYVIASVSGTTMNLVRADDYEIASQMKHGGQVAVSNGTYGGKTYYMFEEDVVVNNESGAPVRFGEDLVNPDVSVLIGAAGVNLG